MKLVSSAMRTPRFTTLGLKLRQTLLSVLMLGLPLLAQAFDPFVVRDIKIEGLQRITDGTVLNYLPISVGEEIDRESVQRAVRSLYGTDFFKDIELLRDGSTLIVNVAERPTIAKLEIDGAKKLGGDELKENLSNIGLAEGRIFRQSILDQVQQEIRNQYFSNGRYGVEMTATVEQKPGNRVDVLIDVDEGRVTNIKRINIVGNTVFDDELLVDQFTLREQSWRTALSSKDQYSQQKLLGDLETLAAFYQDRGYVRFAIESVEVSMSPDRRDIYVTVNIDEGEPHIIGEITFAGETIIGEEQMRKLLLMKTGDRYSRQRARSSAQFMTDALANSGYAFAEVEPEPREGEGENVVDLHYVFNPGKRVYVRRIEIVGNDKTNDETFRREMRLLEGDWFSQARIKRSQARISRLPYVEDMSLDTVPVPGTDDQVDLRVSVSERAPGSVQLGVGFSGSQGFLINGSVAHSNFRGTGSSISTSLSRSETSEVLNLSYTNPYHTDDGIGRTLSGFFRRSDALSTTIASNFTTDVWGGSVSYRFPLSETNSWSLGGGFRETALKTFGTTSDEVNAFTLAHGTLFQTYTITAGWSKDTRNRAFFATKGFQHRVNASLATPLGDLEYYRLNYNLRANFELSKSSSIHTRFDIGYSDVYGDTQTLPPYERYFAGGPESVRGYRASSLGPRDSNGNAFGGLFRTVGRVEVGIPTGFKNNNRSTRLVSFVDFGNVFNTVSDFDVSELRGSYGLGFYWLTPILGLMRFSYAIPVNNAPTDELDRFQFTFGTNF
ncbi:MAG: outer membrane protein assembly factor BamA [Gammaproteobacteria bacterium]|nr:outer membrane protein assembly factor BamA [Gammaproteobacteria bacterium]